MLLLSCSLLTLVLGMACLVLLGRWSSSNYLVGFLELILGLLVAESFLMVTTLLLPAFVMLTLAAIVTLLVVFVRTRFGKRILSDFLLTGLTVAILGYPLILAILDSAISTRHFESDRELLEDALRRTIVENLALTTTFLGVALFACAGGFLLGRSRLLRSVGNRS